MSFMEVQVTDKTQWWIVELDGGESVVLEPDGNVTPEEWIGNKTFLGDVYGVVSRVDHVTGYGVRLSAPGYLDCTEWEVFTNKKEALKRARELDRENRGEE